MLNNSVGLGIAALNQECSTIIRGSSRFSSTLTLVKHYLLLDIQFARCRSLAKQDFNNFCTTVGFTPIRIAALRPVS